MANRNSSRKATIPAVGYLRRSTQKQEKSLTDQRAEIERYAEQNGYELVRWYQDDGISGDETEKRAGFQAMHRAACNGRDFDAILCWDQDRFGRFNSLEAGYWIHPLMQAGVRLVTCNEGAINWHDFSGRMIYSMKQEGKHQFLVDLSRNTARGQISNAAKGFLCGQAAPYGFDRMLVDERGEHKQRVRNGEQIAKHKSWHVTLVPSDEPLKVQTVRWLFKTYASTDIGLRALADALNSRKVPGPGGKLWWLGTIRAILMNDVYVGTFTWAKRRLGKYHRVAGGEIKGREDMSDGGGVLVKINPREEWTIRPNAHPALIDAETFKRVQAKLGERKNRTTPNRQQNPDRYLLSGVVVCGHCGRKMYGTATSRTKAKKTYVYPKYVCSTYQSIGTVNGCGRHAVDQDALLRFLVKKLVFCGGHRDALRARVLERLEARKRSDPKEAKRLRVKLAEHEAELATGTRRLLRAPDNVADLLGAELSDLRKQRDRLADELASLEQRDGGGDVATKADATVDRLWGLADELHRAEPARLRELLRRMVERIDLWFDHVPRGKRVECPLSRGSIVLRQDPIIVGLVCREFRGPVELFLSGVASWEPHVIRLVQAA